MYSYEFTLRQELLLEKGRRSLAICFALSGRGGSSVGKILFLSCMV